MSETERYFAERAEERDRYQAEWREEWRVWREKRTALDRVTDERIRQLVAQIDAWRKPE